MANLKHCIECGQTYDYDDPPCPHCGAAPPEAPAPSLKAGWYRDPDVADTIRFWDGDQWTDSRAPAASSSGGGGFNTWKGIRIVAVGVLAAAATIWVVVEMSGPSDAECAIQRAEYAMGTIESWEVDSDCR